MKKILIVSFLSFALVMPGTATLAGGSGHGGQSGYGYKGGHGGYGYKGGHGGYRDRSGHGGYGGYGYKSGYGGYGYKSGRYGYGGHDYGDEILIGAGIVGVSILLGSVLSRPSYYQPAPAYYQPAPTCYQDEVWRRLPDGRIQSGVRTRCY